MLNTKFEVYKLVRELKRCGRWYTFLREGKNQYGEPDGTPAHVCCVPGLYHEQNSNVELVAGDTTQIRTKKIPMILCLCEPETLALRQGDYMILHGKKFVVTGVVDVQEWGLILDVSLEVVDSGV